MGGLSQQDKIEELAEWDRIRPEQVETPKAAMGLALDGDLLRQLVNLQNFSCLQILGFALCWQP